MKNLITVSLLLIFLMYASGVYSATCTAIASTNYTTTTTWSCGVKPPCGSTIIIPAGYTVTITTIENYYPACTVPMRFEVYGRLIYDGGKLRLPTNSEVYIYSGGSMVETGPGSGNSSTLEINGSVLWNASSPPASGPSSFPTGLLPVELTYFKGQAIAPGQTELNWETISELNNQFFTVERSRDGLSFESIHTMDGAGNSNSLRNYEWIDKNALSGFSYYRLKQTDFDGKFDYSNIVFVQQSGPNLSLNVHPNPSDGDVTVIIPKGLSAKSNELLLKVTDVAGKVIIESKFDYSNNQMNVSLMLDKGFYTISVESLGSKLTKSAVVH